jgi:hypothetical protein
MNVASAPYLLKKSLALSRGVNFSSTFIPKGTCATRFPEVNGGRPVEMRVPKSGDSTTVNGKDDVAFIIPNIDIVYVPSFASLSTNLYIYILF